MKRFTAITSIVTVATMMLTNVTQAVACPFCVATTQTFTEEIASMDAVVFAKLVKLPPPIKPGTQLEEGQEIPRARFQVVTIVKGKELVKPAQTIEAIYFGEAKLGTSFLVMAVDPPKLMWSTPLEVAQTTQAYILKLDTLPKDPVTRLEFFQQYLESEDEELARDSYDEFANSPYDAVKALKPKMDHTQLLEWIKDTEVPASRRRLYLTMLGVCGSEKDLPMLESLLSSSDRKKKAGLDALIGCYLTLKGPDGLKLIEDLFIRNKKSEYADTYAAVMALRFHGTESDIIPRERILVSMRYMLDRPQLADLVIPDLARWEDWTQVDRMVKLFKDADEETSWVRVPVINYLRQCPLDKAKDQIKVLEKIDPAAVKRANTFFPFGPTNSGRGDTKDPKSSSLDKSSNELYVSTPAVEVPVDVVEEVPSATTSTSSIETVEDTAIPTTPTLTPRQPVEQALTPEELESNAVTTVEPSNLWYALGVPFLAGLGLLLFQWRVMSGSGY